MHKNQFDKIRILAALVVIFSHHYPLTGTRAPAWLENQWLHWSVTGGVGVMVFFCISGYLVTMSWYREPQFVPFLWKRVLRLWPGMLGSVLCGVLIFGILFNTLSLGEYLNNPTTWRFFWTNLTLLKEFPFVPGTFTSNPVAQVMNGVYWTIPMEFLCYLVLAGLGLIGLLRWVTLVKGLLLVYMAGFLCFANPDITGHIRHWIEYPAFFAAGAFIALHKEWFAKHGAKLLLVIAPILLTTYFLTPFIATSRFLLLPVLVIYLGNLPARDSWFSRLGDPSYGIYLYGYPIAQSVVALWPDMNFWASLTLTCALSICAGYASWLLLESRALRWKGTFQAGRVSSVRVTSQMRSLLASLPWAWFWPLLTCFVGLRFIVRHWGDPVSIDAAHVYLPMAQAFLEQGWSVLLQPESYHAAPLSYLWPALWSAEPTSIRTANMGLWIGCVWFMWRTCHLLGGVRVAALAMLLLLSPEMVRYFPSELTEPVYLFGIFGWMHAMARIIGGQERSWTVIAQGAGMLTITLLSRPVLQLIAPAMLLASLAGMAYWAVFRKKSFTHPAWQECLPTVAMSLALGLLLPLALVIKNGMVFGLWGLGTGAGIGLYLGTHPLFQGAEPMFLGLGFDVNLMVGLANVGDELRSVAGDAATRQAALWQIQSMSLVDAMSFFGRKLWWWLAHHPAQIEALGSVLRKLRFFELTTLIAACLWLAWNWLRRRGPAKLLRDAVTPRQWALAAFTLVMFLGMLAQLLPVLHNSRYSSTLLDPWLIPLAALGLALLTRPVVLQGSLTKHHGSIAVAGRDGTSPWPCLGTLALILALTFGGYNLARKREYVAIDPGRMGRTLSHLDITDGDRIQTQGMDRQGERVWVMTHSPAALMVRVDDRDIEHLVTANMLNALWDTEIALNAQGRRCRKSETAYQLADGRIAQPPYTLPLTLPLRADGVPSHLVTHGNFQLRPQEPGYLRLVFHCPVGTQVEWRSTRLLESRHAWDAAANATLR